MNNLNDLSNQSQTNIMGNVTFGDGKNEFTFAPKIITYISADKIKKDKLIKNSPYRGLSPFENNELDSNLFFGRDQLILRLMQKLTNRNLVLLLGASGSGKSSIIKAGLIPQLRENLGARFSEIIFKPDRDPFLSLFAALSLKIGDQEKAKIALSGKPEALTKFIRLKKTEEYWLIYIDQFEELFTSSEEDKRDSFIQGLRRLYRFLNRSKSLSVKIIMTMRADFLDRFDPFPSLGEITQGNIELITTMYDNDIREAIEQPAAKHGVVFEDGLVKTIIEDIKGQAGYLPLLQYTLDLLWKSDDISDPNTDRTLNRKTYNNLGGVRGALQSHIEYVYTHKLKTPAQQKVAKRIFLELVQWIKKDGGQDIPVSRRRIYSDFSAEERETLEIFRQERLIVNSSTKLSQESLQNDLDTPHQATVEIAHEILLNAWERLKTWIEEVKDVSIAKSQLQLDLERYTEALRENKTQANDELLRGVRLENILEIRNNGLFDLLDIPLNPKEIEFIELSLEMRDRQLREKQKQVRMLFIFLIVLVFATFAAGIALWQWRESVDREETSRSLQLSAVATNYLHTDTTRSLLLAIQANVIRETPQSHTALWNAFKANHERYYLKHTDPLVYGEFDPHNSKRLLTGSNEGEAVLWDLDQLDKPKIFKAHTGSIKRASFDPYNANRFLTVSSNDKEAHIWDTANSGAPMATLKGHNGGINYSCFDPQNPNQILTASSDGTAIIWNVNTRKPLYNLKGHEGDVWMASFAPDNSKRVLTVSRDGTARVWNLDDLKNPIILRGHKGSVLYGSFDPKNSNRLLTTGDDGIVRIWNLQDRSKIELEGHIGSVSMGVFSPTDSKQVLTVGDDSTVRLWNIDKPKTASNILRKHEGKVTFGNFAPQNQNQILTVGVDGKGYIWDATTGNVVYELNGHSAQINFALFEHKKISRIVTVSNDKTVRIWSLAKPELFEISQNEGVVYATFSNHNKSEILTIDRDGKIKAWDFKQLDNTLNNKIIAQLNVMSGSIKNASLNPNNFDQVVLVNINEQVEVWDINKPDKAIYTLHKGKENAKSIKFSTKNSNILLIANDNGTINIHNLHNPQTNPTTISSSPSFISSGEFDPTNSERILTTTDKGEFIVWNIQNPNEPKVEIKKFVGDMTLLYGAFDPLDTNRVLITGSNSFSRFYNLRNTDKEIAQLEQKGEVIYVDFGRSITNQFLTVVQNKDNKFSRINLWDLNISGQPMVSIDDVTLNIVHAFFSSSKDALLTLSDSGNVKIYSIDTKDIIDLGWQNISRCMNREESTLSNVADSYRIKNISNYIKILKSNLRSKKYDFYCEQNLD